MKLNFSTVNGRAIQFLALLETDVGILPRRWTDLLDLDLLQLLLARRRLTRLRGVGREAPHELLQVRDPVLRLGVRRLHPLPRLHRGQHEIVVVARIDLQLLEVEVRDVRAHLIQEVAVVADDHHRGIVVVERAFQPADGIDVEVVGRLVEQQHVRPREQRLRQQHAQLQARRHLAHRAVVRAIRGYPHRSGSRPPAPRRRSRRTRRTRPPIRPLACSRRRWSWDRRISGRARCIAAHNSV